MSVRLLHRIAREQLPYAIAGEREVDAVRILVLGGHLKADVPPPVLLCNGRLYQAPATVTAITALGRMLLRSCPPRAAPSLADRMRRAVHLRPCRPIDLPAPRPHWLAAFIAKEKPRRDDSMDSCWFALAVALVCATACALVLRFNGRSSRASLEGAAAKSVASVKAAIPAPEGTGTLRHQQRLDAARRDAARVSREVLRPDAEPRTRIFSVLMRPYVKIEQEAGLIWDTHHARVGYQYQLLVNGIPVYEPHVVVTERREVKEMDKEKVAELLKAAHKAVAVARQTLLAGSPAFFLLGQDIVEHSRN
jgi:hypothetical protein